MNMPLLRSALECLECQGQQGPEVSLLPEGLLEDQRA